MKLVDQVIVQKLGRVCVAYDNNKSMLHEFNEVGYTILTHIEKGSGEEEIVEEVAKEYDVSKDQAKGDVGEFLEDLVKKDLITL